MLIVFYIKMLYLGSLSNSYVKTSTSIILLSKLYITSFNINNLLCFINVLPAYNLHDNFLA